MSAPSCPACASSSLRPSFQGPRLDVEICASCGHRVATHRAPRNTADYHAQYDSGGFMDSLRVTRQRQARGIVERLRRHIPQPTRLLDFGAGRGWFLEGCREAGVQELAGADISELSVNLMRDAGIPAMRLPLPEGGQWHLPLQDLPFRPRILTLLDVVEHFPGAHLTDMVRHLVTQLAPELEWVVLKVPVASGLLYRVSRAMAGVASSGLLEQLYQAGTFPPHESYFTHDSMEALLPRVGLERVDAFGDLDFEADSLADRAHALRKLPRPLVSLAGQGLGAVARGLSLEDAGIFIARVSGNRA
ncbi:methyltransferase domain-containing protein [Corallococcus exiguus]|uniref:class I SAM-dependent methyltransferase n=1 Tax=Corallococcus exiguus TaxID=83462 RepID=UPI00147149C1|nr:methyltransferase domain-containing protein [Corallococcus exiguus]NNB84922.1 methyltransferase domain-containing protein [Corallococcus exiguus]NNB94065.1 methyltransferase domain-containing protein [Corallococcus exiguus]NNC04040.1 methyltransferase domain-containing protein [Corallococcus exiguus]